MNNIDDGLKLMRKVFQVLAVILMG